MVNSNKMQLILQKKKELEEIAKAEKEKLEAQALEADISARGQISDVELQRQKALQEARTSERKEQRKIDLPITKPKDIGTKERISKIESVARSGFATISKNASKFNEQVATGKKQIDFSLNTGLEQLKGQEAILAMNELVEKQQNESVQAQIAKQQSDLNIFKEKNIEVAPNKWYDKTFWNSLNESQKQEVIKTGRYTIQIPENPALTALSSYKKDKGYDLVTAIRDGHIDDVRKAADEFGLSQLDVVDLQIKAADVGVQNYLNSVISDYNTNTAKGIDASILRLSGMTDQEISDAIAKGTNVTGGINIRPKIAEAPIISPMSAKEQFDYSVANNTIPDNAVFDGDSNDGGFMYHIPSEKPLKVTELVKEPSKTISQNIFPNPAIQDPETHIKSIWRILTPWDESAGETFLEYEKKRLKETFNPVEKTQAQLAEEYSQWENMEPILKLFSTNNILKMEDGTYVQLMIGEMPSIGKKGALSTIPKYVDIAKRVGGTYAKTTRTISPEEAGMSESTFANFLKVRETIPDLSPEAYKESLKIASKVDWVKIQKAIDAGEEVASRPLPELGQGATNPWDPNYNPYLEQEIELGRELARSLDIPRIPATTLKPTPTSISEAAKIAQQVGSSKPTIITPSKINFAPINVPIKQGKIEIIPNKEQSKIIDSASAIVVSNAVREATQINVSGLQAPEIINVRQQKFNESIDAQLQQIPNINLRNQIQSNIENNIENIQIHKVSLENQIQQIQQQSTSQQQQLQPSTKIQIKTEVPTRTINFTRIIPPKTKPPESKPPEERTEKIPPPPEFSGIEAQTKDGQIIELSVGAQIFKQGRFYKAVAPPYTKLINLFERPKGVPALETGEVYVVGGGVPRNVKIDYGVVDIEIKNGRVSYIGKGLQTNVSGKGITKGIGISNIPSGEPTLSEAILLEEDIKPIRKLTTVEEFNSPKKKKSIANNYINSYDELKEMYSMEKKQYLNEIRQKAGY